MTPRQEILRVIGWAVLDSHGDRLVLYRWDGDTRVEVTIHFDSLGRVYSWSEWRNTRVGDPDQDSGRRARLMDRLAQ